MEANQPTREEVLGALVQNAAQAAEGSFADRNPVLGKMRRCPFCGRRRRENGEPCCNPSYTAAHDVAVPRSAVAKKRKNPRLSRNNPPLFEVHARLVELEAQPGYVEYEGISAVVEGQIVRRKKAVAEKKRGQQKLSRMINRGK